MRQAGRYLPSAALRGVRFPDVVPDAGTACGSRCNRASPGVDAAILFRHPRAAAEQGEIIPHGPTRADHGTGGDSASWRRDGSGASGHRRRTSTPAARTGARRTHAAYRVRRCAVHRGDVPCRGRRVEIFQRDQVAALQRARAGARTAWHLRRDSRRVSRGAGVGADAAMLSTPGQGCCPPADFDTFALPYVRRVLQRVQAAAARAGRVVPRIYYAGNAGGWIDRCRDIGADVIGLDWRLDLDRARRSLPGLTLQGNLDPAVLLGTRELIRERASAVLDAAGPAGHVFNLGHGILPETAPDHARFLVTCGELSADAPHDTRFAGAASRDRASAERRGAEVHIPEEIVALIRRYARLQVPRYTSYPTAVEFSNAFDEPAYRAQLARAAASDEPLSLYLHLPFCEERCSFCGCSVIITKKRDVAAHYLDYLHREIAMLAESSRGGGRSSMPLGGTPTYLSLDDYSAAGHGRTPLRRQPGAVAISRPACDVVRSARAARAPRVQPALLRRARLRARRAGGGEPGAIRVRDAGALRGRPPARLPLDQPRSDLRPSVSDPRVVRPYGRHRRQHATRSRCGLLLRARAVDSRESEEDRSEGPSARRAEGRALRRGDGASWPPAIGKSAWITSRSRTTAGARRQRNPASPSWATTRPAADMVACGVSVSGTSAAPSRKT